jgi:hypothetical protein
MPNDLKTRFEERIAAFSKARRRLRNAELAYRLGGWAAATGVGGLLLLSGWMPSAFLNLTLFALAAGALIYLAVAYLRRRNRFRSHLDEAFRMEELEGGLNSRLVSALDFLEEDRPTALMQVAVEKGRGDLKRGFEDRMDQGERDRRRKIFAGLALLFLLLGLTPWFGFGRVVRNLRASLFAAKESLFPVLYEVSPPPGTHVHRLGEEVELSIAFRSRGYDEVDLVEEVGKKRSSRSLPVEENGRAGWTVKGEVESEHRMHFEFGRRRSDEVVLVFADRPILENMQTELVYPAYTRILPRNLEGVQERIFALAGTRITLGFTFSKELVSAVLTWDDGTELPLEVVGRFASVSLIHRRPRRATLQVEDVHGFSLEYPLDIDFEVQEDEKPQVYLPRSLEAETPTLAQGLKLFGFGARLKDDFGVEKCILKWQKATVNDPSNVTRRGEIERTVTPPRRNVMISFQKMFKHLAARPGDRVSFKLEVYDNRHPEAQVAVSPTRALFVYQEDLEGLNIASLRLGGGKLGRSRIKKSKRATSVKAPQGMRTKEKVWNEYEADIDTKTRAPAVPGEYSRAVKDYLRLMSTAVRENGEEQNER